MRLEARLGDGHSVLVRNLQPKLHGNHQLGERFTGRISMRGAWPQVRSLGNPEAVLIGPINDDSIAVHANHPASTDSAGSYTEVRGPDISLRPVPPAELGTAGQYPDAYRYD